MAEGESKSISIAWNLPAPSAVGEAVRAAEAFAGAAGLGAGDAARLAIIVEELVTNVVEHGGVPAEQCIELSLATLGGDIALTLEDPGAHFDPRGAPAPDPASSERGGGAGIAIVQAWSRVLSYAATGGVNRLELVIPRQGG